jgi:hypothetical protein
MFFKREKPRIPTFAERLDQLRASGYAVSSTGGGVTVSQGNFAAVLREGAEGRFSITCSGLKAGDEVALLTDAGFQKIFLAPSGAKFPALAEHLKQLHAFTEDLREALGLPSLYNESLGTINEKHLYDRVEHRDTGPPPKPWEKPQSPGR